MSIARRLLLLLGVCCSALLLQGGWGLFQIRSINQNIAAIEDNVLPSLKSLEHAQTAFLLARVPATRYLLTADLHNHPDRFDMSRLPSFP